MTELLETTTQLPQVATDLGGFLLSIAPSLFSFALIMGIVAGIFLIIVLLLDKDIIRLENKGLNLSSKK